MGVKPLSQNHSTAQLPTCCGVLPSSLPESNNPQKLTLTRNIVGVEKLSIQNVVYLKDRTTTRFSPEKSLNIRQSDDDFSGSYPSECASGRQQYRALEPLQCSARWLFQMSSNSIGTYVESQQTPPFPADPGSPFFALRIRSASNRVCSRPLLLPKAAIQCAKVDGFAEMMFFD